MNGSSTETGDFSLETRGSRTVPRPIAVLGDEPEDVAGLLRRLDLVVAAVPLSLLPRIALGLSGIQGAVAARLLVEVQSVDPAKVRGAGPLIPVKEAATRLGVTPQWIYKNPRAASLLVRMSSGTLRVSVPLLEKFIRRNSGGL